MSRAVSVLGVCMALALGAQPVLSGDREGKSDSLFSATGEEGYVGRREELDARIRVFPRSSKADRLLSSANEASNVSARAERPESSMTAALGDNYPELFIPPGLFYAKMGSATDYIVSAAGDDDVQPYGFGSFADHAMSIPLEILAATGGMVAIGFTDWKWGSSKFNFQNEGFFGKNTKYGGMDKLGHAFTSALLSDFFTDRIRQSSDNKTGAAITGAALSLGIMTLVEYLDGTSTQHGASYEDLIADALGVGFSYLRNTIPGMRDKVDFRIEYFPSGESSGFHPISDYSGQKYLLAFKAAGLEVFQDTPFRFLELHAGYYARGYTSPEKRRGAPLRRRLYAGIGINLSELLLGSRAEREHVARHYARFGLEHFQVPFTYAATSYGYNQF